MKDNGRLMYIGQFLRIDNSVRYKYIEILEDNTTGEVWTFRKRIFRKGTIGSIYNCSFEENRVVSYNKNAIPTSYVNINGTLVSTFIHFEKLTKYEEESRQVEAQIRNSKKPQSPLDEEIKYMKQTYKSLSPSKRAAFIGNLVYKVTS